MCHDLSFAMVFSECELEGLQPVICAAEGWPSIARTCGLFTICMVSGRQARLLEQDTNEFQVICNDGNIPLRTRSVAGMHVQRRGEK